MTRALILFFFIYWLIFQHIALADLVTLGFSQHRSLLKLNGKDRENWASSAIDFLNCVSANYVTTSVSRAVHNLTSVVLYSRTAPRPVTIIMLSIHFIDVLFT